MRTFFGGVVGALVAATMMVAAASAADYRVVSFGDSLSDSGNVFDATGKPTKPYFQGRFTNGRVWTELLAGGPMVRFNQPVSNTKDTNYAFGTAWAGTNPKGLVPGVGVQIDSYIAKGGKFAARDVVTLLAGANDIKDQLKPTSTLTQIVAIARGAADAQQANLRKVLLRGAKIVVVATLPPIDKTPFAIQNKVVTPLALATGAYNARLAANVAAQRKAFPKARILLFDLNGLFKQTVAAPAVFGFTNVTKSCVATPACVGGSLAAENKYLFWDELHPTGHAHQLVAFMVRWDLEH